MVDTENTSIGEGFIESHGSLEEDPSYRSSFGQHHVEVSKMAKFPSPDGYNWSEEEGPMSPDPVANSFMPVETPQIGRDTFGDDKTAAALENCKKTVLFPYHIFLKCIGWRRFKPAHYDMHQPLPYRFCNIIWPISLIFLLLVSCVTQILLCFSRDLIKSNANNSNTTLSCSNHIVTSLVILDFLLVGAFVYGLYIFRILLPEYLSTFTETVFLGIISRQGNYSPKHLIRSLQFFLLIGLGWILYSFCVSIVRIFAHHLDENAVHFEFLGTIHLGVRILLIVISMVGFIVFDIAYTAVVINYSMQCQLMVYYMQSICTRILAKEWEIDEAIKQIHTARQFLAKLNSHLSRAVGTMMFIFLYSSFNSIYGLQQLKGWEGDRVIIAIAGFLGTLQWTVWLFLPLIQAARVTRAGYWLKKTALEIRSRPFSYKSTPQLDLDSFVSYCCNIQLKAKLVSIPISPALVVGGAFLLGFVFFLVFELDNFTWARWL